MREANLQQVGMNAFVATKQELFDYHTELRKYVPAENRLIAIKFEKKRNRKANQPEFSISGFMDPDLRKWLGWPVRLNSDGTYEFRKIPFTGVKQFNLNNIEEAYEYFIWTRCAWFKGSRIQEMTGNFRNLIVTYDAIKDQEDYVDKRKMAHSMEAIILEMSDNAVTDFGMIYKINPKINAVKVIRSMLLNKLNNNPASIKADYDNYETHTQYLVVYRKAEFAGLIKETPERGVMYRDMHLGTSFDKAIERLKQDTDLYIMLKNDAETTLPSSNIVSISNKRNSPSDEAFKADRRVSIVSRRSEDAPEVSVETMIDQKIEKAIGSVLSEIRSMLTSKDPEPVKTNSEPEKTEPPKTEKDTKVKKSKDENF